MVLSNNSHFRFGASADARHVRGDAGMLHHIDHDHDLLPIARALVDNAALFVHLEPISEPSSYDDVKLDRP